MFCWETLFNNSVNIMTLPIELMTYFISLQQKIMHYFWGPAVKNGETQWMFIYSLTVISVDTFYTAIPWKKNPTQDCLVLYREMFLLAYIETNGVDKIIVSIMQYSSTTPQIPPPHSPKWPCSWINTSVEEFQQKLDITTFTKVELIARLL